jgi:hypothetical protein
MPRHGDDMDASRQNSQNRQVHLRHLLQGLGSNADSLLLCAGLSDEEVLEVYTDELAKAEDARDADDPVRREDAEVSPVDSNRGSTRSASASSARSTLADLAGISTSLLDDPEAEHAIVSVLSSPHHNQYLLCRWSLIAVCSLLAGVALWYGCDQLFFGSARKGTCNSSDVAATQTRIWIEWFIGW